MRAASPEDSRIYIEHPMQPVAWDGKDVVRFKENPIVRFLLDAGPFDLNQLAVMPFQDHDRDQFAQLIGYSVSGWGELSYVKDERYSEAREAVDELMAQTPKDPKGPPP